MVYQILNMVYKVLNILIRF